MIVTGIHPINKTRYKVDIDGEFAFVLYGNEIKKYKIEEGYDISKEQYDEIVNCVLVKRAKLRAMNLLTKHSFTEMLLRRKLRDGYYSDECIEKAIEYVKAFGYINDLQYAKDYIFYHLKSESRQTIKNKLMQKGISVENIEQAFDEFVESEVSAVDDIETEQIRKLFQKKYNSVIPDQKESRNKMMNFFLRKGYKFEQVKKVIHYTEIEI